MFLCYILVQTMSCLNGQGDRMHNINIMRELNNITCILYMHIQHNVNKDKWLIQGITKNREFSCKGGGNPQSHAKTDVWRLAHMHDAGRSDHLSASSTHSHMMKTNRGMFPGQRREMEFSWSARKKNLPRRIWRLPNACTTVNSQEKWYWILRMEGHQSQHHSLMKTNQAWCCHPCVQLMTNLS